VTSPQRGDAQSTWKAGRVRIFLVVGPGNSVRFELVDGCVQLLGGAGERVAGVAEPVGHLLPAHPAAPAAVVVDDGPAALADGPCRDRGCLDDPAVADDLEAEAGSGEFPRPSHTSGSFAGWSVAPKGRPPWRGRQVDRAHAERPLSGVEEEKKSLEIGEVCPLTERTFFRPSTGAGRVHPDLPAKIGRSASGCRVPGAAREARGRCPAP
jgi:hypothetical protein